MLLRDKVVIITGVGPGMGCKMAKIAAAEGAKVVMSARSATFIDSVAAEIVAEGGQAIAVPSDVTKIEECDQVARIAIDAFGRIDGLVNSAFRFVGGLPFGRDALSEWQASLDVALFGTLKMIDAVLPHMKARREGSIVNVSTRSTMQPLAGEGPYVCAKTALLGASRQLAVELGPYNIRVNSPRMGWLWGDPVRNYLTAKAEKAGVPVDEIVAGIVRDIPLGVIPPDEECAKAVLLFLSDYTRMVTGTSLDINGGQFMM